MKYSQAQVKTVCFLGSLIIIVFSFKKKHQAALKLGTRKLDNLGYIKFFVVLKIIPSILAIFKKQSPVCAINSSSCRCSVRDAIAKLWSLERSGKIKPRPPAGGDVC
jgi:hypothetical protein